MTTMLTQKADAIEAAGRSLVYSLLATGFGRPTIGAFEVIESGIFPGLGVLDLPEPLQEAIQQLRDLLPTDLEAVGAAHVLLFPPVASQDAPGYEIGYRGDGIFQQTDLLADIAGFYRAHGLRAGGAERERLDHIVVELEFMSVLARKEFLALQNGSKERVEVCRDTARSFLSDHLACWAPAFGRRVGSIATHSWYRALGGLLAIWIEHDLSYLDVSPLEVADEPRPQEPLDDGSCGPCPTPVSLGTR